MTLKPCLRHNVGEECPMDKHHVVPRSRGGKDHKNLATICRAAHDLIHFFIKKEMGVKEVDGTPVKTEVTVSMTPVEIITWWAEYAWGGRWGYVQMALDQARARGAFGQTLAQRDGQRRGRRAKKLAKAAVANGGDAQDGHA